MLHVVLYQPEIPHNTGAAGRLCLATGSRLHLVKPLGFSLDDVAKMVPAPLKKEEKKEFAAELAAEAPLAEGQEASGQEPGAESEEPGAIGNALRGVPAAEIAPESATDESATTEQAAPSTEYSIPSTEAPPAATAVAVSEPATAVVSAESPASSPDSALTAGASPPW